jgi:SAM-dependent methyltransferase
VNRLPDDLLRRMADRLDDHDRDEMAIPSYLHPNPAMRWMAWRRLEVLVAHLDDVCRHRRPSETTLLDFGCGTGVLFPVARTLAHTVIGVDPVLDAARLLLEERPELADVALHTPEEADAAVADHSIDVILAAEVLEHVEPLGPALERFRRWLAPGGRLVISLPTENRLYRLGRRLAGFEGHYHHANAASITRDLARHGFGELRRTTVPAPGPAAIYWVATHAP